MKGITVVFLGILGFVLAPLPVGAQPKKDDASPEAVARKALDALKADRIEDFAKMMHPDELKKWRTMMADLLDEAAKKKQERQILGLFKGAKSVADLKKVDDVEFFAKLYQGLFELRPELKEALTGADAQMIGTVQEGKDMAHVVYRLTVSVGGAKAAKVSVLSLRRTDKGWAMMLTADVEGLAGALKQRFGKDD